MIIVGINAPKMGIMIILCLSLKLDSKIPVPPNTKVGTPNAKIIYI